MNVFTWIGENFKLEECTSDQFVYNDMDSQSGYCLPIIYKPFDGRIKWHWGERGAILDFLYSTQGEGKRVLDFGPGDGWPSLLVAPFVAEVVGLDASPTRVKVCTENARRMGITNATFVSYTAGGELPFADNSFDGIMASSSVEQSPDPQAIIREFYRILQPGGKLRISYESLNHYRGGQETDIWLCGINSTSSKLILFSRNIEEEYALQYAINVNMSREELREQLVKGNGPATIDSVSIPFLEALRPRITGVSVLKTVHPSGKTLVNWLKEAGFSQVFPTHSGQQAVEKLYDQYTDADRPSDLEAVTELVKPFVKMAVQLVAPIELDPMITAIK